MLVGAMPLGAMLVGAMVVEAGVRPSQVKLRSLSVPMELKVTKPGWLVVIWLLIHV